MASLGFGFMRLPLADRSDDSSVLMDETRELVDRYMAQGGNFFDTAFNYHNGLSEVAIRETLVKRYPRDSFILSNKLPPYVIPKKYSCEECFQLQLERCGVDYFDYYLIHSIDKFFYKRSVENHFFEYLIELKKQGRVGKIGFSYHDTAELLEQILIEQPSVEVVLLQINFGDWESEVHQSRKCYEVAERYGKEVWVMETVKGGTLSVLPPEGEALLKSLHPDWTLHSWAFRFAASLKNVSYVLSGMNVLEHVDENIASVAGAPLSKTDWDALLSVADMLSKINAIPCTDCRYCIPDCPANIPINEYFKLYNYANRFSEDMWLLAPRYQFTAKYNGAPTDCTDCKNCEERCPQHIEITSWLKEVPKLLGT